LPGLTVASALFASARWLVRWLIICCWLNILTVHGCLLISLVGWLVGSHLLVTRRAWTDR
jgi:hypothetical protein